MKATHLILFDDSCSFCWRNVAKIRSWDRKGIFVFSPIQSAEAKKALKGEWEKYKEANTLILLENSGSPSERIWIRGRAVMRIFWLLGGYRKLLGWLAFVPLGVDSIYTFIARRRHRL